MITNFNNNSSLYGMSDDYQESLFASAFRDEVKKKYKNDPSMYEELTAPVSYPTTFLPLDYMNGMRVEIENLYNSDIYCYDSLGFGEGGMVMIIGKSGTAKTSFAIQACASIACRYPASVIIHEDIEGSTTRNRIRALTGWGTRMQQAKYIIRQYSDQESFFDRLTLHCEQKLKLAISNPKMATYNTGIKDGEGNYIYKIVPSFIILDSLPLLVPRGLTEDEKLCNNMSAANVAKQNSILFKRLTPQLKRANVLLIVINHIKTKFETNMFAKTGPQINYLKSDETLPGGGDALYLANNIFKFTCSTKLTDDKEFGINGFYSNVQMIKSRANRAGQTVPLVFNQEFGFDRILSCYKMLKDEGAINGSGAWFHIDGLPNHKFQQRKFMEKFSENPVMREAFKSHSIEILNRKLTTYDPEHQMSNNDVEKAYMNSLCADDFDLSSAYV